MSERSRRRSPNAQINAIRRLWSDFKCSKNPNGLLIWRGVVRPKAQRYQIAILWKSGLLDRPYVTILDPPIRPRPGGTFEEIPHLIFDVKNPECSGLCLFDPEGKEWTESDLIAETTIYWVSEWLLYYELWHMDGVWLGPSVGYESVAEIRAAEALAIREAIADVH